MWFCNSSCTSSCRSLRLVVSALEENVPALLIAARARQGSDWVRSPRRIAHHYLKGSFTLDLVSTLPFGALSIFFPFLSKVKSLRLIRLLRLLKLLRILRGSRIIARYRAQVKRVLPASRFSPLTRPVVPSRSPGPLTCRIGIFFMSNTFILIRYDCRAWVRC